MEQATTHKQGERVKVTNSERAQAIRRERDAHLDAIANALEDGKINHSAANILYGQTIEDYRLKLKVFANELAAEWTFQTLGLIAHNAGSRFDRALGEGRR